jgi:hypothetical protein
MRSLQGLFDEILRYYLPSAMIRNVVARMMKLLVRRVYDEEEMKELRGIASATGVDLYLLVTLNNLLDCLLGCTSGAVLAKPTKGQGKEASANAGESRLMHFRTLDWGMDGLRDLLVVLEFVNSKTSGSEVLTRSITYAGFVGTLTAVRYVSFLPGSSQCTPKLKTDIVTGYRFRSTSGRITHALLIL